MFLMTMNNAVPLLKLTGHICPRGWRQINTTTGSRITKYKNPFVGGIYKKIQRPIIPRKDDEYATEGENLYPEIKGVYPPGEWGKMDVDRAWKFHARSKELHKIGSLRERLYDLTKVKVPWVEKIESKEKMKYWIIEPSRERPYFFPFLQYVTKTRLSLSPTEGMIQTNPNIDYASLQHRVNERALLAEAQGLNSETRVAEIVDLVNSALLACNRYEHLVEGQMEEDINFSASWRRCGFEEDDMDDEVPKTKLWVKSKGAYMPYGGYKNVDPGIINFQGHASAFLALRSRFPLKEVVSNSELSEEPASSNLSSTPFVHDWVEYDENSIPLYAYHPSLHGLKNVIQPPLIDPGYRIQPVYHRDFIWAWRDRFYVEKNWSWNAISDRNAIRRVCKHHWDVYNPGVESDPRGFPHTAFLLPTKVEGIDALGYDADGDPLQQQQWDAEQMLTTLFTWNVAAAHYQGFCSYIDLTYPIVSQGVITDGYSWQFYTLQTDSIEIWRDDDAFKKGSEMWMTRKMNMDSDADVILKILVNVLSRETRRDLAQEELQPFVTKSDEVVEVVKPKYDFEMKVL